MLSERFDAALLFASFLHRRQVRKATGLPYISHLLAVSSMVIEDGGTEDEAIAALLHDAVEDCGDAYPGGRAALRGYIEREFGAQVLEIVNACTDDDEVAKGKADSQERERAAWRERKRRYIEHIATSPPAALRVACADKIHNVRSTIVDYERIGESLWERFRTKSGDDQIWYYMALADAFSRTNLERLPILLRREVDSLVQLVERRRAVPVEA
jgi:GTP pyrophosphokinase